MGLNGEMERQKRVDFCWYLCVCTCVFLWGWGVAGCPGRRNTANIWPAASQQPTSAGFGCMHARRCFPCDAPSFSWKLGAGVLWLLPLQATPLPFILSHPTGVGKPCMKGSLPVGTIQKDLKISCVNRAEYLSAISWSLDWVLPQSGSYSSVNPSKGLQSLYKNQQWAKAPWAGDAHLMPLSGMSPAAAPPHSAILVCGHRNLQADTSLGQATSLAPGPHPILCSCSLLVPANHPTQTARHGCRSKVNLWGQR